MARKVFDLPKVSIGYVKCERVSEKLLCQKNVQALSFIIRLVGMRLYCDRAPRLAFDIFHSSWNKKNEKKKK